jgi:RNA polymerase sigma factor (sigma-70 family)
MLQEPPTRRDDRGHDALLQRARAGDRAALDALFEQELPRLRRWASGRLPRWARDILDTSDLIQETVLETFKRLDAFEPRGDTALQAYLRQTQVNRLRNQLRRVASPTATTRPAIGSIPTSATR